MTPNPKYLEAVELVRAGATLRQACAEAGLRSHSVLHKYCKRAGIDLPKPGRKPGDRKPEIIRAAQLVVNRGISYRDAAKQAGANPNSIGAIWAAASEIRGRAA